MMADDLNIMAAPTDPTEILSAGLNRMSMEDYTTFHPRPDFGTAGTKLIVAANMYQAKFAANTSIFHYDVKVKPVVAVTGAKLNKNLAWKIWGQMQKDAEGAIKQSLMSAAYDQGAAMYTPIPLPGGGQAKTEITVILDESGQNENRKRYKVLLTPANKIDMNSIVEYCQGAKQSEKTKDIARTAIQAANILLRQDPYEKEYFPTNHGHKFLASNNVTSIPNGAQVHLGFMQSFRPTQSGYPAIQLDTAYSACLKPGMLIDVIGEMLGSGGAGRGRGGPPRGGRGGAPGGHGGAGLRALSPIEQRRVLGVLRMTKFKVTHRQTDRAFTFMGFGKDAETETFVLEGRDGKADQKMTVAQYFKTELNITVTKPGLPCVRYGKRNLVPMEFVKLEPYNRIQTTKLTGDQAAAMIKVTAKPPPERMQLTKNWRKDLDYDALPKVKAWGMSVNPNMMTVNARQLPSPMVTYGNSKTLRVQRGAWNVAGSKFFKAGNPLKAWGVLIFDTRAEQDQVTNGFMRQFEDVLGRQGVTVQAKPSVVKVPREVDTFAAIKLGLPKIANAIKAATRMDPQLIICVVGRRDLVFYKELKKAALYCWEKPIVTQIMQSAKMFEQRGLDGYMGNLSMKIQAKVGGITHTVSHPKLDSSTMMIGADVTHPPAQRGGFAGTPQASVAVTVAAINGSNNQFKECIRLQAGTQEIISGMPGMVKTHLETFIKNTNKKPEKIIMFRDGVSEGQYGQVVERELVSMRAAAREIGGDGYNPKITFVVCAKRHHMRFYATAEANKDKTGNLHPGIVVDSGVTDPFIFEFYLQAHPGLQGTAKPTHYVVVSDDNKFKADEMQSLCNALCYTYARAARAVSLIPVAYYADVIAGKCRDFIYTDDDSSSVSTHGTCANIDPLELKNKIEGTEMAAVAWYM